MLVNCCSRMLTSAGATVLTASSAAEAIRLLRLERDVVLVSDIEMPGRDGYELLRDVRSEPDALERRVISVAVTAYARAVDRQRARDAGFDAHLSKPVDPDDLIATIAGLIAARVGFAT